MMREEFEALTGIFPDCCMYEAIEAFYVELDMDKADFCEAFKANTDGLATKVQAEATKRYLRAKHMEAEELVARDKKIRELTRELELEQEWRPRQEDPHNVSQFDYDDLKNAGGTRVMGDEEAKELLYSWFGFAREKVTIYRTVPVYEVNRHRLLRKSGAKIREPLYNATDWNYIRFDCGSAGWELYNDELRPYYQ